MRVTLELCPLASTASRASRSGPARHDGVDRVSRKDAVDALLTSVLVPSTRRPQRKGNNEGRRARTETGRRPGGHADKLMDNMRSRHSTLRELQRRAHVRAQTLRAEDLDRLITGISILPTQTKQPGQAEGVVPVQVRDEYRFDLAWLY